MKRYVFACLLAMATAQASTVFFPNGLAQPEFEILIKDHHNDIHQLYTSFNSEKQERLYKAYMRSPNRDDVMLFASVLNGY